jgi:lysyl-tRNA synthetase class 2
MLATIRRFFAERDVLEVETPLLCQATGTDPNLSALSTQVRTRGQAAARILYLQTSPEFAMKRLLAAGSGSIYQIGKAFRNEECGRYHNPEFTLLEWYRLGIDLHGLMDEFEELLWDLCPDFFAAERPERITYRQAFERHTGLNPLGASTADFTDFARRQGFSEAEEICGQETSIWLDFLFSHTVQPNLGRRKCSFVFHYPACQSSLARLNPEDPRTVERVEVFHEGIELANGFRELTNPVEQAERFDRELALRRLKGLPQPQPDRRLLAALEAGLPECSGIAVGLDRLLMRLMGKNHIADVLAFPLDRA